MPTPWFDATAYQLRIHALETKLEAFESGSKYLSMKKEYDSLLRYEEARIKKLEYELSKAHSETISVRKIWSGVVDDLDKEHEAALKAKDAEIARLKERILEVERQRDNALDKVTEWRRKFYDLSEKTEEVEELNKKLTAQVNKDFETSSVPSSQQGAGRKKIPNSREKTDRKRGGQKGHEGHRLSPLKPTESYEIPAPPEFMDSNAYYPTGEYVRRQKIGIEVRLKVIEYFTRVFRNCETGSRKHAEFPDGYTVDVSYDSSIKSLAFLLANECNVSAGKIKQLISELTKGKINISEATINGLVREFAAKTEPEREFLKESIMTSGVVNADFTNANVDGDARQVFIIASPDNNTALYIARDSKGHAGIADTPLENYVGTVVHDHDTTFYSYGLRHQECMQHNIRYLRGSIENEPDMKWNKKMLKLIQEMIHYKNSLGYNDILDPDVIQRLEKRYDRIIDLARQEYEDEPPGRYYREGYNLFLRLEKYKESQLLFLHDKNVPSNNSLAERLARVYKRKQKQAIVLRSEESFINLCDSLSVLYFLRGDEDDMFDRVMGMFNRPKKKPKLAIE